jgi:hypothetical protein
VHQYSSNTSLSSLSASKLTFDSDQNNQDNVTLTSAINLAHKEFIHLPRVNIELVGLPPNKAKLPDNIVVLTQLCMSWLVDELVERKYLRSVSNEINGGGPITSTSTSSAPHYQSLTELCDNLNMLYMNTNDQTLHDCCDMDSGDSNFTDHINDYQKRCQSNNNNNVFGAGTNCSNCSNDGNSSTTTTTSSTNGKPNASRTARFKSFKITDQELNAIGTATPIKLKVLHDNEIICTYQLSESTFVTICTLTGKLITLSVHILPNNGNNSNGDEESDCLRQLHSSSGDSFHHYNNNLQKPSLDNSELLTLEQQSLMMSSTISTSSNDLERLPKMQTPRCSHGAVAYQNKLYVIGGYDRGECLNLCEVYDPVNNTLEEMRSMHCRRGRAAVTWYARDTSIYVIGGSDGHEDLNSLEYYNIEKNEWRLIKFDYQLACTNLGAIACENSIYLVGLKNEKNSARTICLKYEPEANKFTRLANLNNGRSQSALVWLQTSPNDFYLYVFGGYDQYRCLSSCELYNITEDKWSLIPSMHENRRGCGAAYHAQSHCIYIVGGTNGSQSLRSVEIYDVKNKKWRAGPELNIARTNVAIAFIGKIPPFF